MLEKGDHLKRFGLAKKWMKEAYHWLKAQSDEQLVIDEKTSRTDLVTQMDKGVERFLVGKIESAFPLDAVLGEEKQAGKADLTFKSPQWVIDPIDGTMNFVQERRHYAHILAFYDQEELIFGILVEGDTGHILSAFSGEGVYYQGEKLEAPDKNLDQGLIEISASICNSHPQAVTAFLDRSMGIRITGSSGLTTIEMALGSRIAYVAGKCAPWDMVVARLIAKEWGFKLTDFSGQEIPLPDSSEIIFAHPRIYPFLLQAIQLDQKK